MYLNIILTLLVTVLITITTGVYFWWKNYGKKMFTMMEEIKKISSFSPKSGNVNMDTDFTKRFNEVFSNQSHLFDKMNDMFAKYKK